MPGELAQTNGTANGETSQKKIDLLLKDLEKSTSSTPKIPDVAPQNGTEGDLASPGTLCTIRNLYEGPADRRGRASWTTTYPDDLEEPPENAVSAQFALIVRNKKSYDGKRKLETDSIVVQSALLKKILGYVLEDYPSISTTDLERLEFRSPFAPFVHRWGRLIEVKDTVANTVTKDHVNLLYSVLEEELKETLNEKVDHIAHGIVAFGNVWTIFEPGCLVYAVQDGHERVYKLTSGQMVKTRCGMAYSLSLSYVDFDGEDFGLGSTSINIGAFQGTTRIVDLPAYPLSFHRNAQAVKEKLTTRGQLFESYKGYHFRFYEGVGTTKGAFGDIRFNVSSRIIIDTYAYNRFNPNREIRLDYLSAEDDSDDDSIMSDDDEGESTRDVTLTSEQYLMCTHKLRGYSLKDKRWFDFHINSVRDIVWNEHAFESLVAPPEQKQLILAFAESQAKHRSRFDDVIKGKGQGIILLLSGKPGVGKTLTAESVAESMKVPLYMMSAGDLGTTASSVESALTKILEMNAKWQSVLLLDEADVFLEARSTHDLQRNALVSIFLRSLEYYEGILFLTTNRVDNIDAAFESRIHLTLQYDELDFQSRRQVWWNFLSRSSDVGEFSNGQLDKLAEVSMNGRQIKNVLKTAQLLASKQEMKLDFDHVSTVLKLRAANVRQP